MADILEEAVDMEEGEGIGVMVEAEAEEEGEGEEGMIIMEEVTLVMEEEAGEEEVEAEAGQPRILVPPQRLAQ